jgi:hypothetical protein
VQHPTYDSDDGYDGDFDDGDGNGDGELLPVLFPA